MNILLNGLSCLIKNANEVKSKIYDKSANIALDKAIKDYQRVNEKIYDASSEME